MTDPKERVIFQPLYALYSGRMTSQSALGHLDYAMTGDQWFYLDLFSCELLSILL